MKLLRFSCVSLAIVLGFITIVASGEVTPGFVDSDLDGYGDPSSGCPSIEEPGCVADNTDCDDSVDGADGIPGNCDDGANINPDETEVYDSVDNDCDEVIDNCNGPISCVCPYCGGNPCIPPCEGPPCGSGI